MLSCLFQMISPVSKNTHIFSAFSSSLRVISLYSFLVIPTSMGSGASNISMRGCGNMGTNAKHHLNGYNSEFKPRMEADNRLCLPMNTNDFSSSTAVNNFITLANENNENRVGQNQQQSRYEYSVYEVGNS